MSTKKTIWRQSDAGVYIPVAQVSDASVQSRTQFLELRNKAKEIERLYLEADVPLAQTSDLGRLVENAKALWEIWFLNSTESISYIMFFRAIQLDRIADSVLPLRGVQINADYLKILPSASLNFFAREPSEAKDIFWELEVWSRLLRRNADANLEEPDIVVNYDGLRIGIACKKFYSEKHVQNVLSEGVRQIERDFDFGVVAINLDDLLPENVVLKEDSTKAVAERLLRANADFIQQHQRHLKKYLSKGRLISAIVSTSVLADVSTEKPQFRNTSQWTVWTISGLDAERQKHLNKFYAAVMSEPSLAP